jgi:hypothetical protein
MLVGLLIFGTDFPQNPQKKATEIAVSGYAGY